MLPLVLAWAFEPTPARSLAVPAPVQEIGKLGRTEIGTHTIFCLTTDFLRWARKLCASHFPDFPDFQGASSAAPETSRYKSPSASAFPSSSSFMSWLTT
jgi:hypothetical protein